MAFPFFSSDNALFPLFLFFILPLHLLSIGFRVLSRRPGVGRLRMVQSAAFLVVISILLLAIVSVPDAATPPKEESAMSELEQLRVKVARLESILEEHSKDLNSKVLYLQEKDRLMEEMSRKIQFLHDSLHKIMKSQGGSSYSEEMVNSMEEEVRQLWGESRKNNFNLHILESKAYDAKEKLDTVNAQVQKMEDIINEQWIQIRQLEQALQITKMRTSKASRKIKYIKCTFLKFIEDFSQYHLPKAAGLLDSFVFKDDSLLRSFTIQAFKLFKRIMSAAQRRHHELQGFVKKLMKKNKFTSAYVNKELVFFLASVIFTSPIMCVWVWYTLLIVDQSEEDDAYTSDEDDMR